ncbi:MAG: serine hydrolase [Deltaproteobacteria bacterium]|nr:serine hydrolase [Deltaproteobacteria bacterium]
MIKAVLITIFLLGLCACGTHCRPFPAPKPCYDPTLQSGLESVVERLSLEDAAAKERLAVILVDITQLDHPYTAGINANQMMYAASLPKIAILYGVLKLMDQGALTWDPQLETLATEMIRDSSNSAATELFYRIGPHYIAALLQSDPFRFYDRENGGGIWVGKEYGPAPAWRRDPLGQISHAATPVAVARLYYYLETGELLSPKGTFLMNKILSNSSLDHKFLKGLARYGNRVKLRRKSGSWRTYHSDSAIVEHNGRRYIAVALTNDPKGSYWLERLIAGMDWLILSSPERPSQL